MVIKVAIDFTGSNGSPSEPDSLHYLIPSGRLNQYQQAIVSIGSILQDYDTDKMFPVYGFGGMLVGEPVSHCFPIYERYVAVKALVCTSMCRIMNVLHNLVHCPSILLELLNAFGNRFQLLY